jgi:TrmH family RNA methyltransferase
MAGSYSAGHQWQSVTGALCEIKKIQSDRLHRDKYGVFFIEGVRNFVQAMDRGLDAEVIFYSERLLTAPLARKLVRKLRREGTPAVRVSPEEFRKVSRTKRASGVGAVLKQNIGRLHCTSPRSGLCWVVLERVRSNGNLGTLVRTSEAIGGAGFILLGRSVDPYEPVVVRASMGAIFGQQFIRTNSRSLQHWVRRHRCSLIGASTDGTVDFHQYSYPGTILLFLGEERKGLTRGQRDLCHHLVRIPMVGTADSLNLGVAGSLLIYEVYRSRHTRKKHKLGSI